MHHVHGAQTFAQPPVEQLVARFDPLEFRSGRWAGATVHVNQHVVLGDELLERHDHVPVGVTDGWWTTIAWN